MLVRFIATGSNMLEKYPFYKKIVKIIEKNDSLISYQWIDEAYKYAKKAQKSNKAIDDRDWHQIMEKTIDDLHKADICIFDTSESSFGVGFQASYALHLQKPCLIIKDEKAPMNKFGSGIVSNLLVIKTYKTQEEALQIVEDFVNENRLNSTDLRFNFVIDREIYNYLKLTSYRNNTTKAEVIRKLLREKINKER